MIVVSRMWGRGRRQYCTIHLTYLCLGYSAVKWTPAFPAWEYDVVVRQCHKGQGQGQGHVQQPDIESAGVQRLFCMRKLPYKIQVWKKPRFVKVEEVIAVFPSSAVFRNFLSIEKCADTGSLKSLCLVATCDQSNSQCTLLPIVM